MAIDLSYIYFSKLDKKQESIDLLVNCLKEVTEEGDKEKLQARLNKMTDKEDNPKKEEEQEQEQEIEQEQLDKLQFDGEINQQENSNIHDIQDQIDFEKGLDEN